MVPEPSDAADGERRSALLIDWGGVLTTNLFASFHAYCLQAEIDPKTLLGRFRTDPAARELLIALEKGELEEDAFELQFAALLERRARRPDRRPVRGRAARQGDGAGRPQRARGRRAHGARVELLGRAPLPARAVRRAVRRRRDLRRGGHAQALAPHVRARRRARRRRRRSSACSSTTCRSTSRPPQELGMATVHHTSAEHHDPRARTAARVAASLRAAASSRQSRLPRPYINLNSAREHPRGARLVRVHEQFLLHRQFRR